MQQEDDARVALRALLPEADDEASQGETTSVETPEGRLHRLGVRLSRRDRDRDSNLRQIMITVLHVRLKSRPRSRRDCLALR